MNKKVKTFNCDICGSNESKKIEITKKYTKNKPIHVCVNCGFVFVKKRRDSEAIAEDWSKNLFGAHYSAHKPYMRARHVFLAETLQDVIGPLRRKKVCDIGAGEGAFLNLIKNVPYSANVFGIEPSPWNGKLLKKLNIKHFTGTVEKILCLKKYSEFFDVVTIMWTLENCENPNEMLSVANFLLKPNGYCLLATSSRILVPFKKPLNFYLSASNQLDTHCFRFSANSQKNILIKANLNPIFENRYIDHDILCTIAKKQAPTSRFQKDNYNHVISFFNRWHKETKFYINKNK